MKNMTPRLLPSALFGIVALTFCLAPVLPAQTPPGLPEPGLFIYGPVVVATNGQPIQPVNVQWQVSGAGDAATLPATCVSVNGSTFFVVRVPFETRSPAGVNFTRTPGTFDLKSGVTNYTRLATVDGAPAAILSSSRGQLTNFLFSAADRGLVERVVLGVNRAPTSNSLDTDGDGVPDWAELIAGTDPNNGASVFKISPTLSVNAQGGLILQWQSVAGRKYDIYRSTDIGQPFTPLASGLPATPALNTYSDNNPPTNAKVVFYRISARQ